LLRQLKGCRLKSEQVDELFRCQVRVPNDGAQSRFLNGPAGVEQRFSLSSTENQQQVDSFLPVFDESRAFGVYRKRLQAVDSKPATGTQPVPHLSLAALTQTATDRGNPRRISQIRSGVPSWRSDSNPAANCLRTAS
jgi:hypothetical protein